MRAKVKDRLAVERMLGTARNVMISEREKKAKLVSHLQEDIKEQQTGIKRDRRAIKTIKSMRP
ncbi:hypothetical protein LCGC14_0363120 [marine sediment metagenome]|uniref:Uncharacterized protein n=1 Tax=marine sediment metagenome TaxID=412755 RepID=A0A0F9VUG9_9ZZZZ